MTRIYAYAVILVLLIINSACDDNIYHEGDKLILLAPNPPEKLIGCNITSSEGITYELFPNKTFPGSYIGDGKMCIMEVHHISPNYAGLWSIETITKNLRFISKFTVKMKQQGITRPTDNILSSRGQWATVWVDSDSDNVTSCYLTNPQSQTYDLMKEKIENLTRVHGCGVRMLISSKMQGKWTFSAQFGDYIIKTASFYISIPFEENNNDVIEKKFEIGRSARLKLYEFGGGFCQLTKPDGTKLPLIFGSCVYKIPSVSLHHSGIWKVLYRRPEKLLLNHAEINVTIIDPDLVEGSSTLGNENEVHLLCRTGLKRLEICTFIRPDKHVINVPESLGNDKYSYYGHGYQKRYAPNRRYSECGLTIRNPSEEDYGLWTCRMGLDGKIQGAVINVVNNRNATEISKADHLKVFVKRGDDFMIRCSAKAVLRYCWLTSPNGTDYSVSSVEGDKRTLMYDGKGFSMGECGAIIKNANDTDNGQWICHMGIVDEMGELETNIEVKVAESYVVATEDTVYAQPNATFSCHTFPDGGTTIQHCRWIRPNGHGINEKDAWRYNLQKTTNECSLTILTLKSEDIGKWQCVASFSRAPSNEEHASIELKDSYGKTDTVNQLWTAFGSALGAIALIGAAFAGIRIYKRKNSKIRKSPPAYSLQDYTIPKVRIASKPTSENKDLDR